MKDVRMIKGLQSQVAALEADVAIIKIELSTKQREYQQKLESIKKLKTQIERINEKHDLKISEHAIVRYFERVKGFSIEEIEQEILSVKVRQLVEVLGGSGTYPNENGYSLIMKNHTVTTIV